VSLKQSLRLRKLLGRAGAVIVILFFAAVLDSCVARFRAPLFTVHLLPGASELVEGQVDHDLKELSLLRVETSHASVQLQIERFQSGYWLGGSMWVGVISAAPEAAAGTYALRVFAPHRPPATPVAAFQAIVYPDYAALRRSFLSVMRRRFDIAPGMVALACLPALGLVMGLFFLLGRGIDRLLADQGRAEVFLVKSTPGGTALYFGLGRRHGVVPGMRVDVWAESGRPICAAVVQQVDADNAMALAEPRTERLPPGALAVLPAATARKV
jgi:hypothetical protein